MRLLDRSAFWIACLWLAFIIQWMPAMNKPVRGICDEIAESEKLKPELKPEFIQKCKTISESYERRDFPLIVLGTSVVLVFLSYRLRRLSGKTEKS